MTLWPWPALAIIALWSIVAVLVFFRHERRREEALKKAARLAAVNAEIKRHDFAEADRRARLAGWQQQAAKGFRAHKPEPRL